MTITKSTVSFVLLLLFATGLLSNVFANELYCITSNWTDKIVGILGDSCFVDQWWATIDGILYSEFIVEDDVDWF